MLSALRIDGPNPEGSSSGPGPPFGLQPVQLGEPAEGSPKCRKADPHEIGCTLIHGGRPVLTSFEGVSKDFPRDRTEALRCGMRGPFRSPGSIASASRLEANDAVRTDGEHDGVIQQTANGNQWVVCSCGWISHPSSDRAGVEADFQRHAPTGNLGPAPLQPSREEAEPTPHRRRRGQHQQIPSEMIARPDGSKRFRARCSCGWTSDPVEIALSFAVWEEHQYEARYGPRP